jgi:hypothetical protein
MMRVDKEDWDRFWWGAGHPIGSSRTYWEQPG